jgi:hypothetical protein
MSTKNVFKMGFLSVIAATGLFVASNGFAADAHTARNFEGMKTGTGVVAQAHEANEDTLAVSGDLKIPETPASRGPVRVMDSKGNVYLLIPMKAKDGKEYVEYLVSYTNPTSR